MSKVVKYRLPKGSKAPKERIIHKVFMYFIFTIAMSWSQIIVNGFISFIFNLTYKSFILYKAEICFMTIVLVANNIKDLIESHVLKKGKLLFDILLTLNILNATFSLLFSAGSSFLELSGLGKGQPELRQFVFVMMTYILAVFMGLAVQIGGGIDG
jgi:hypothetical protein